MKLIKYYKVDTSTKLNPKIKHTCYLGFESDYGIIKLKEIGYVDAEQLKYFSYTRYTTEGLDYGVVGLKGYEIENYDDYLLADSLYYVKKKDLGIKDN